MTEKLPTAVIGAGVIGASWTALFSAHGHPVAVYDPDPGAESTVRGYIDRVSADLAALGASATPGPVRFCTSAAEAVREAGFVQENVPERIEIKHALFAEIEPHLAPNAVVASSASGLMLSEMQPGWRDPSCFVLGHPFNPPHLIPLVELLANDRTGAAVLEAAEAFYTGVGKVTIRVQKELPGHVANRLQAALWREAIHLVETGAASVEDVDKAVWAGPGLRWAAMGPHMLFHLGAGPGGLGEFCARYRDSFHRWWADMGTPDLTEDLAKTLMSGVVVEAGTASTDAAATRRDALIVAFLKAAAGKR